MDKIQVLNSDSLKRRFIKDAGYPIALTDNPYFLERLGIQNYVLGDKSATNTFDLFVNMMQDFNNEQEYFEYYKQIKESMMEDIKNSEGFKRFNNMSWSHDNKFPKNSLYKEYNDKGLFVSIDMKQANFSALHYFDPLIFDGCCTWELFMKMYTKYESIINSKYIRQVVLGNCNPKHQIQFEDLLMTKLAEHIHNIYPGVEIYSVHNDEILIDIKNSKKSISKNALEEAVQSEPDGIGNLVRVEVFELHKIPNTDGWEQIIYSEPKTEIKFKCLDAELFPQYVKHYYDLPITENDLVFRHNGRLAKFMKEVDNPWK